MEKQIKAKERKESSIFFITLDDVCNNRCIGCSTPSRYSKKKIPAEKIKKELLKGVEKNYEMVHFFGGEVTLREDLIDILKFATKHFPRVAITTNGRRLSDKNLVKKLKNLNLSMINVSLHGHKNSIHEAWTQTKGSFIQTVEGIKNLLDLKCPLTINHVVWKGNFLYLDNFLEFIYSLGALRCAVLNLNPIGRARENYRFLKVDLKKLLFLNDPALKWIKKMKHLTFEDFPFCLFNQLIHRHPKIAILNTSGKVVFSKEGLLTSYGCAQAKEKGINIFSNLTASSKKNKLIEAFFRYSYKNSYCSNCKFFNQCDGVFAEYFSLNPLKAIKEILLLRKLHRI